MRIFIAIFSLSFVLITAEGSRCLEPNLSKSLVLRHRVVVLPVSQISKENTKVAAILKMPDPLILFPKEGVVMDVREWATAVDLTRIEVSKSEYMRLVEPNHGEDTEIMNDNEPDIILLVSYGIAEIDRKLFVRLIEASSGQVIYTSDVADSELKGAIQKSVAGIEEKLLTLSWRCRVVGTSKKQMVINRGSLDGLREGIELIGYSLKGTPQNRSKEPQELLLMKYGEEKGLYKVVEVRDDYAKVETVTIDNILAIGDILEMPEVKTKEWNLKSRGSKIWEKRYKK